MPLCHKARRGNQMACYNEHKEFDDMHNGCGMIVRETFPAPHENMRVNLQSTKSNTHCIQHDQQKDQTSGQKRTDDSTTAIRKRAFEKELQQSLSEEEDGLLEEEGAITKRTRHKGPNKELDSSEKKIW